MPAPRNIEELKRRTLGQVAALKAKNVKVSGRGIFEFMSSGNLTGPPHRDIAAKMPGPTEINRFKGKQLPAYNNLSTLLFLNVFIGEHKKKLMRTQWFDKDYCTPCHITTEIKHVIDVSLSEKNRGVRHELRAAAAGGGGGGSGGSLVVGVRRP